MGKTAMAPSLNVGLLRLEWKERAWDMYPDDDLFIVAAAMATRRFEPVSDREERRL